MKDAMYKIESVRCMLFACHLIFFCTLQYLHFPTYSLCNICTLKHVHFAGYNVYSAICIEPVRQIIVWVSWTDQLHRSASQTSWTDQFSIFEILASLHIRRLIFQFVRCCSFRVLQRPCFL